MENMKFFLQRLLARGYQAIRWRMEKFIQKKPLDSVHILPTLRCNLRCPYCTNFLENGAPLDTSVELTADDWVKIVKKVKKDVIITGGEPLLFSGIEKVLNSIPLRYNVQVYTNMTIDPSFLLDKVKRNVFFYCSCHPSSHGIEQVKKNFATLLQSPYFRATIHCIETEQNRAFVEKVKNVFAEYKSLLYVTEDKREIDEKILMKEKKHVKCMQEIILIGPDGYRYPCSTFMFQRKHSICNMLTDKFENRFYTIECNNWGCCASCDGQTTSKTEFLD